jgi:hypothetical protein
LREARTVARLGIVQGKFYPQELSANPMVHDLRQVAPLYGYIATTPKPAAEIVLASAKLDPILAAWQYGLGRSVAWTSDAAGLWTRDWLRMKNANRFWANLVSWAFPASGAGHLFISTSSSQGQGHISVTTPSSLGANPSVTAHVLGPNLRSTTVQLEPSAPGQFGGSFDEGGQGAYFVTVEAHGAGHGEAGQVGMDVSYSPEYRTSGVNMSFLRSLAAAGGGSVITQPDEAWSGNLPPVVANYDVAPWLLLLAILLLPIDIGVRRLVVSRRELRAIAAALPFRRTPSTVAEPAVPLLGALRERRAQRNTLAPHAVSHDAQRIMLPRAIGPATGGRSRGRAQGRLLRAAPTGRRPIRKGDTPETGTAEVDGEESIGSRLLAAKRKSQ